MSEAKQMTVEGFVAKWSGIFLNPEECPADYCGAYEQKDGCHDCVNDYLTKDLQSLIQQEARKILPKNPYIIDTNSNQRRFDFRVGFEDCLIATNQNIDKYIITENNNDRND